MYTEFSLLRDGDKLVSPECPHFKVREFRCPGTNVVRIHIPTVVKVETLFTRGIIDYAHVNSGYRNSEEDLRVGGKGHGPHVDGIAFDFTGKKGGKIVDSRLIAIACQEAGILGIGYMAGGTHVDGRTIKCFFDETKAEKIVADWKSYFGMGTPAPVPPASVPASAPPVVATKAGDKIKLEGKPLFASFTSAAVTNHLTGTYFFYDDVIAVGRRRITNSKNNVKKTPVGIYCTGFIDV